MRTRSQAYLCTLLALLAAAPAAGQSKSITAQQPAPAAEPLRLDALVAEALRSNPGIRAAAQRVEALEAAVPQARALPDPSVTVGWMGRPAPFVVIDTAPTSNRSISAMETFPFPGKLRLRGDAAAREAEAARWSYEATRREVIAEVKVAYYEYGYLDGALAILESNRLLLEKLSKIAETRYESGQGLQQDVLKGQLELSELLERITMFQTQESTAVARLNTLLNRDPETPLPPPAPLTQSRLAHSLADLYRLARAHDADSLASRQMIAAGEDAVALARKSYDPDFTVSYMYQRMAGGMNMNGAYLGVNIPIFYKSKQREEVAEASENLASERSALDNRQTTVDYLVKEQYLDAEQAAKLVVLYSQAILPQSSETLASAEVAYQTGKADFLTMLDNFINLLDYRVNSLHEIADYQIALARLEPLVGVELAQ